MTQQTPMVNSGILTLSFRTRDFNDRELVKILLRSIESHWKGKSPFFLSVIVPDAEVDAIEEALTRTETISLSTVAESECLGVDAKYLERFDWWRRQLLIKLLAPGLHSFGSALILNSDAVCIADFDESTFVDDGKLISDWEQKAGQAWWGATARLLDMNLDQFSPYGLSVTPNVISCELARLGLQLFSDRFGHLPTLLMHARRIVADQPVAWTNFSLYTLLGELTGVMETYHVAADRTFRLRRRVRSEHSIWRKEDFEPALANLDFADPDGVFLSVQCSAKLDPEWVRQRILQPTALRRGGSGAFRALGGDV
jgi:hypothetical protein